MMRNIFRDMDVMAQFRKIYIYIMNDTYIENIFYFMVDGSVRKVKQKNLYVFRRAG